jgi:hypothetical protein
MATIAQIDANRLNSQLSTGPVTAEGKSNSSRNARTFGLFTHADYVKPDERELYAEFCATLHRELAPVGLIEETLAAEVTSASWRLRRCSAAEADLADYSEIDPLLDDAKAKQIRSIERARAAAQSAFHRSVNQLRRLQTERASRDVLGAVGDDAGLIDFTQVTKAINNRERGKKLAIDNQRRAIDNQLASICNSPEPAWDEAA